MKGLGDKVVCAEVNADVRQALQSLYDEHRVEGFHIRTLTCQDDVVDDDLHEETIAEATGGIFPCVYVDVTYRTEHFNPSGLLPIEDRSRLSLVATCSG